MYRVVFIAVLLTSVSTMAVSDPTDGMPSEIKDYYALTQDHTQALKLPDYKMYLYRGGKMYALLGKEFVTIGDAVEGGFTVEGLNKQEVVLETAHGDRRAVPLAGLSNTTSVITKSTTPSEKSNQEKEKTTQGT